MSILHTVYVYERDEPRVGKRDKRENRDGLQGVCCVCVCAKPVSLIGQMSCVHYKGGTLERWEGVSPGIRSVGQQSTRPQGGLSGWFTGMMERMCHAKHVCVLKSHLSQQPAFRHEHVQRDSGSAGLCALNFSKVLSKVTFTCFDWCPHRTIIVIRSSTF